MNKKNIVVTVVLLMLCILGVGLFVNSLTAKNKAGLAGSDSLRFPSQPQPTLAPIPTPQAPATFLFDSSTDLQSELEKVNPQVLDADFES